MADKLDLPLPAKLVPAKQNGLKLLTSKKNSYNVSGKDKFRNCYVFKINDEITSNYLTTPLALSAGTALISTPAQLPSISSNSSIGEVNDYLDALVIHLGDFENNLVANPDWKKGTSAPNRRKNCCIRRQ